MWHGKLLGVVRNRIQQKSGKVTACNLHTNWLLKLKYMYIPKVLQEPLKITTVDDINYNSILCLWHKQISHYY